jgi:aspartyl/asparaginyl-tRNA synthetase
MAKPGLAHVLVEETMETLEVLIAQLPRELHREVQDYIEFLLEKRRKRTKRKPRFDWAGAMHDLRDQYTSVELQHEVASWRRGEP